MADRELPTEPGSIIGWITNGDGFTYYGSALLDYDAEHEEWIWWRAGYNEAMSPEAFSKLIGRVPWVLIGQISQDSVSTSPESGQAS